MSGLDSKKDFHPINFCEEIQNFSIQPSLALRINPNFVHYISENLIVFVSGSNIILYDFETKKQKFIPYKNHNRKITYISVGYQKSNKVFQDVKKTRTSYMWSSNNSNNNNKFNEKNTIYSNNNKEKKDLKDICICVGEYSEKEGFFYITVLFPYSNSPLSEQRTIKSTEKNYIVKYATILNGSPFCVTLSQKSPLNNNNNKNTLITSRLSFIKYFYETFNSQVNIQEDISYVCYNPKNTIDMVLCGKGYLRLWNVFINEGTLKEHQERFLRGKQEKEKNFIKAEFFERKPFLLIVGTTENIFYIIDSFTIIHELNVCYSIENIFDLNIQNLIPKEEENDEAKKLKNIVDGMDVKNIDSKLRDISFLISQMNNNNTEENKEGNNVIKEANKNEEEDNNDDNNNNIKQNKMFMSKSVYNQKNIMKFASNTVFNRLYKTKIEELNDGKINKKNKVKFFELLNDNLLFVIFSDDGCTMIYKIDWNRKIQEGETEAEFRKWKATNCRVIRLAKNIKNIIGYSIFKPNNDIILISEVFENTKNSKNKKISTKINKNSKTSISLYKLRKSIIKTPRSQNPYSLQFDFDCFEGFFDQTPIKLIDMGERKQSIFFIDKNNILTCFDILKSKYSVKFPFNEEVNSLSVNPINNLFAVAFPSHVSIYGRVKDDCHLFANIQVNDSIILWSAKGDFLLIAGRNRAIGKENKYCLYFLDSKKFNTMKVIENLEPKISQIKLLDNDKYLFCLIDSQERSIVIGLYLNLYNTSNSLHELIKQLNGSHTMNYFHLIFSHATDGYHYCSFDWDPELDLLVGVSSEKKSMHILTNPLKANKKDNNHSLNNNGNTNINIEIPCNLLIIKIIKELHVLIGGDNKGSLKVFSWPFKGYEKENIKNINDNLKAQITLDLGDVSSIINFKNYTMFASVIRNSTIFLSELLIMKDHEYKTFEYFQKALKPQIELLMSPYLLYDIRTEDMIKKEKNVDLLDKTMKILKITMEENMIDITNNFNKDCENIENNLTQRRNEEEEKYREEENNIHQIRQTMTEDMNAQIEEMEKEISTSKLKHNEKITLYDNEIKRLRGELIKIKEAMEAEYDTEASNQKDLYEKTLSEYKSKFEKLKEETDQSLANLVKITCEYTYASYKIDKDYKKIMTDLDEKIKKTKEENNKELSEKVAELEEAKAKEELHKAKLQEKVLQSDKLIEKNVEVKQNIINATQRTITFQEQLLETEKNLVKIDKKLEDLIVKNKHLEQIRFVLEHRMTSLEKEKAPLEGQCSFLENQKNKLTDEFNKIIFQINKNNQEVENKQSQLRASLIQNYEIHDQKNYLEAKLTQLKKDIEQFLMTYQDNEEEKPLSLTKATKVALNFKAFYDKYFSNSIEDELLDYRKFAKKLQEQTDKDGIANNFDLIMRNKAEEKLICEKQKVEELKVMKENGFRRIQNENTILITECNRLRKSLHEIYMKVIDIELKFEQLTKINPKLSKSEIVAQIKEFIRITHEKIKENYARTKKNVQKLKYKKLAKSRSCQNIASLGDKNSNGNINKKFAKGIKLPQKEIVKDNININDEDNKNVYADVIKVPPNKMRRNDSSFLFQHFEKRSENDKSGLPQI